MPHSYHLQDYRHTIVVLAQMLWLLVSHNLYQCCFCKWNASSLHAMIHICDIFKVYLID